MVRDFLFFLRIRPRSTLDWKYHCAGNPNHVGALSYLGILSQDFCQNYLEAEQYFIRALALEPNNAVALGGYAVWQQNCACNMSQAETYFRRAIECGMLDISNEQCPSLASGFVLATRAEGSSAAIVGISAIGQPRNAMAASGAIPAPSCDAASRSTAPRCSTGCGAAPRTAPQ